LFFDCYKLCGDCGKISHFLVKLTVSISEQQFELRKEKLMDQNALNSLVTAKRLLTIAEQQSRTGDRYAASVGAINLQDALELVFISCLKGKKSGKTFQELLESIEKDGHQILHKPSLLALNNFRVGVKHHGGLIDQQSLKEFLNNSTAAIDHLVFKVFGKLYHEIYSAELIQHPESKALLEEAARILDATPFYPYACLLNIRKAIFINFEEKYSVEEWRNIRREQELSLVEHLTFKKSAPFYTRTQEWIVQNVLNVLDYVQFDDAELRSQLIEYGIASATFFNLLRLTPRVFRHKGESGWKHEGDPAFMATTSEMASYCLSIAVEMILLKENYHALHRSALGEFTLDLQTTQSTILYKSASTNSEQVQQIERGEVFSVRKIVPSFDDDSHFVEIHEFKESIGEWLRGYIPEAHTQSLAHDEEISSDAQ
jgi:hypothetical protein